MNNTRLFAFAAAGLILVFGLAALAFKSSSREEAANALRIDRNLLERAHAPTLGPRDAPVVITEFLDPACETCRAFYPLVKQIMAEHPGRIRLVTRLLPLHPGSDQVVAMLAASKNQGRFWPTLERVLETQDAWVINHRADAGRLAPLLAPLQLEPGMLERDMKTEAVADWIMQDIADARAAGVDKTPGFFVNGRPLEPFGIEPLKTLVAEEVRAATR